MLGGVGWLLAPRMVDNRFPERAVERLYAQAERIAGQLSEVEQVEDLLVGWGVSELVLPEGIPLAGYGARRGAPSEPGAEKLFARAVSLKSASREVVVVMADLLLFNRGLADEVKSQVRATLKAGEVEPFFLFTATHTHAGPGGWGASFAEQVTVFGDYNHQVFEALAKDVSQAIAVARQDRKPSLLAWSRSTEPDLIKNRMLRDGAVDAVLDTLWIRRRESGELGAIVFFGAHATCLNDKFMQLHRDYPGFLVDALESEPEVAFAGFATGSVGSQSGSVGGGVDNARKLGESLAQRVLAQKESVQFVDQVEWQNARLSFRVPSLQVRLSQGWIMSPWIIHLIHDGWTQVEVLRLQDHLWVTVPVEFSSMLSAELHSVYAEKGFALTISCFNGDYLGYVLPDQHYPNGDLYEAKMNFLGPYGGGIMQGLVRRMIPINRAESN